MVKLPSPWQCQSVALRLAAPRGAPKPLGTRPLPRLLELSASTQSPSRRSHRLWPSRCRARARQPRHAAPTQGRHAPRGSATPCSKSAALLTGETDRQLGLLGPVRWRARLLHALRRGALAIQSVTRGAEATVSLCQSRPFVNFQHPQVPGGCLEQMPIRVHTDVHIFGICALIAEANLLVATSLHCRIVALNYHVPRVTFASKPTLTKHAHFGYLWDGDIHKTSVEGHRAGASTPPSCEPRAHEGECHTVVPVQGVHRAISAALEAGRDANWEALSADRLGQLEWLQRHRSFQAWLPTLQEPRTKSAYEIAV